MAFGKVEREFMDELVALVKRAPSGLKVLYGFVSPDTSELGWGAHNMTHLDAFGIAAYIKAEAYRKIMPNDKEVENDG